MFILDWFRVCFGLDAGRGPSPYEVPRSFGGDLCRDTRSARRWIRRKGTHRAADIPFEPVARQIPTPPTQHHQTFYHPPYQAEHFDQPSHAPPRYSPPHAFGPQVTMMVIPVPTTHNNDAYVFSVDPRRSIDPFPGGFRVQAQHWP